ncbi:MAG: hypothetical protein IID39_07960 [Planctomycetes bacterium]|nr:hypothetical protein [Planctomycetota bacterium]
MFSLFNHLSHVLPAVVNLPAKLSGIGIVLAGLFEDPASRHKRAPANALSGGLDSIPVRFLPALLLGYDGLDVLSKLGDLVLPDPTDLCLFQIEKSLGEPIIPEVSAGPLDEAFGQSGEHRRTAPVLADVRGRREPVGLVQTAGSQRFFCGTKSDE